MTVYRGGNTLDEVYVESKCDSQPTMTFGECLCTKPSKLACFCWLLMFQQFKEITFNLVFEITHAL